MDSSAIVTIICCSRARDENNFNYNESFNNRTNEQNRTELIENIRVIYIYTHIKFQRKLSKKRPSRNNNSKLIFIVTTLLFYNIIRNAYIISTIFT